MEYPVPDPLEVEEASVTDFPGNKPWLYSEEGNPYTPTQFLETFKNEPGGNVSVDSGTYESVTSPAKRRNIGLKVKQEGGLARIDFVPSANIDITGKTVTARIYHLYPDSWDRLVFQIAAPDWSNWGQKPIANPQNVEGWREWNFKDEDLVTQAGTPDYTNVGTIRIRAEDDGTGNTTAVFDELSLIANPLSKGIVIFTFDDSNSSHYDTGKDILDKYGYGGTEFWIPGQESFLDNYGDSLYESGWDIAIHGDTDLTAMTQAELHSYFREAKKELYERGYRRGPDLLAYPYGKYNDDVIKVARQYCRAGFKTGGSVLTFPVWSPYHIARTSGSSQDSVSEVQSQVDRAEVNNQVLILLFHDFNRSGYMSTSDFESVVDYVDGANVDVMTASEFVEEYY